MTVFLIILATVISTTLGGLFAIKLRDKLHLILGFSAGAVLGVALFDLLPESIELTSGAYDLQIVTILIAAGFSVYMLIDRLFSLHKHSDDECDNHSHNSKLGALAFVVHGFLDGFIIGLAFQISSEIGWVVALAVLAHKFSDGINTVGMIIKGRGNKKTVLRWLIASAFVPVLGVSLAYFITVSEATLGVILAVFVGLFLYISSSDLIPESHHSHPTIWTTISTILGLLLIFIAVQFTN